MVISYELTFFFNWVKRRETELNSRRAQYPEAGW
jgi:hypothetical protein